MKRRVQVCWDATEEHETETDWYATGYLCNYFLSLAEDELQPDFGDGERKSRIQELEEVRVLHRCPVCPVRLILRAQELARLKAQEHQGS